MKRILNEPLLHFLLLGAIFFAVYGFVSKRSNDDGPGRIVITRGEIEHLAANYAKTWQRPPTPEELAGLVRDRVREEVYCREAMSLGLDQNDTFIRRRLRQKMEFISDDIAAQAEPTDADLDGYLKTHPDSFRVEQQYTFRQVYLNPDKHGENLERDAAQVLKQLNQADNETDASAMGDSFLLEHQFTAVPSREVTSQFGKVFADRLPGLKIGSWQGPVESGYGLHLVFISERTQGRVPVLAEVRDAVRREWESARREESNEQFYKELLNRYIVTIEGLEPTTEQQKVAEVN